MTSTGGFRITTTPVYIADRVATSNTDLLTGLDEFHAETVGLNRVMFDELGKSVERYSTGDEEPAFIELSYPIVFHCVPIAN